MRAEDLLNFITEEDKDNLFQLDITIKKDEGDGCFYVVKTKGQYLFEDEGDADDKVNRCRSDIRFAGCDKKHKEAKINKAGEETRPETWTIVAKLNH